MAIFFVWTPLEAQYFFSMELRQKFINKSRKDDGYE